MTMLRPATPADRFALGNIAYETGYFGAPADQFFPSRELFTELWIAPYLSPVGCCNLVAELKGQITGYIVGTCNLTAYARYFVARAPRIMAGLLAGRYPRWRGSLPYLTRMLRFPARTASESEYPAQLHVNLLAEARGQGTGGRLLAAHLACLKRRGVVGVQLSTTTTNAAAIHLYKKHGFGIYAEYDSALWRPWAGMSVSHVIMTKRL